MTRTRDWHERLVADLARLYPGATVAGPDPLAPHLEAVAIGDYLEAMAGYATHPHVLALTALLEAAASRDDRLWLLAQVAAQREAVDAIMDAQDVAKHPDGAWPDWFAATVDLGDWHACLSYILLRELPDLGQRIADRLPPAAAKMRKAERRRIRADLAATRIPKSFSAALEAWLLAWLRGLDDDSADDAEPAVAARFDALLLRRAKAKTVRADLWAEAWSDELLGLLRGADVTTVYRLVLQLPAVIKYLDVAAGRELQRHPPVITGLTDDGLPRRIADGDGGDATVYTMKGIVGTVGHRQRAHSDEQYRQALEVGRRVLSGPVLADYLAVLVDGRRPVDIAAETGRSKQAVSKNLERAARLVREALG